MCKSESLESVPDLISMRKNRVYSSASARFNPASNNSGSWPAPNRFQPDLDRSKTRVGQAHAKS